MLKKKKDSFLKTVADACQILAGWQNIYRNCPQYTKANDGVAFATTGTTEDTGIKYHMLEMQEKQSLFK